MNAPRELRNQGFRGISEMTQEEIWNNKYKEVVAFIEKNKRNPSKYDA